MPFPVILVDSASGSDTAASGAGPAVALTGSAGVTASDGSANVGCRVNLDGSPDLTNVATDGSHVIYWADATNNVRNFAAIVAKGNSGTPSAYVEVNSAQFLGGTTATNGTTKAWAIGGKRASISAGTSTRLWATQAAGSGDAMPGWAVEMQSSHAETIGGTVTFRRVGDQTNGPVTLRGAAAAATLPLVTFSNNGVGFSLKGGHVLQDFELRNSNATKTASVAVDSNFGVNRANRLRISASGASQFWKGLIVSGGTGLYVESCEVANCASHGVSTTSGRVEDCLIRDNGGDGILQTGTGAGIPITGNDIVRNAGSGINDTRTGTTLAGGNQIDHNTIHGNGAAGITMTGGAAVTTSYNALRIEDNNITGNGTYGINLSGSPGQPPLDGGMTVIRNNNFGAGSTVNTSGACSLASAVADPSNISVDPGYANAANNDFAPGPNVWGKGFPLVSIAGGLAPNSGRSYADIGSQQHQNLQGRGLTTLGT